MLREQKKLTAALTVSEALFTHLAWLCPTRW